MGASDAAEKPIRTTLAREEGYRFRVRFDQEGMPDLLTDEPPPLGRGSGPSPSRLLARARRASTSRGSRPRWTFDVRLVPTVSEETRGRMGRCLEIYESFCTVTESIRAGLDVAVRVEPEVCA